MSLLQATKQRCSSNIQIYFLNVFPSYVIALLPSMFLFLFLVHMAFLFYFFKFLLTKCWWNEDG